MAEEASRRAASLHTVRESSNWDILGLALGAQVGVSFVQQGIATLLPFLQAAFQLGLAQVGLVITVMNLGALLASPVIGWITDQLGERRVALLGGLGAGIFVWLASLAPEYTLIVALLALSAPFLATAGPVGTRTMMRWYPRQRRGLPMGIRQTGVPLGGALGALLLPPVASQVDWRAALLVGALAAAVPAIVFFLAYREPIGPPERAGQSTDPPASMIGLLKRRDLLLAGWFALLFVGSHWGMLAFWMPTMRDVIGLPVSIAAIVLSLEQFSGAIGRVMWGVVSDRLLSGRRKPVLVIIGVISTLTVIGISLLSSDAPLTLVVMLTIIFGLSVNSFTGIQNALIAELAGLQASGRAIGFSQMLMNLGVVSAPLLLGVLVEASGSYAFIWWTVSGLLAIGTVLMLLVREE